MSWVAFSSEVSNEKESIQDSINSRSVSVHASSSGVEHSVAPTQNGVSSPEHESKAAEAASMNVSKSLPMPSASPSWEAFGEIALKPTPPVTLAQTDERPLNMETVNEDTESSLDSTPFKFVRPPPKPPIMRSSYSAQKTGSSTRSNEAVVIDPTKMPRSPWIDSDEDAASLPTEISEDNPFASMALQKRYSSGCSLASKGGDASFHAVVTKHGAPQLELVETVNAAFSGNKLTRYSVWGDVKFKLSGSAAMPDKDAAQLSSRAIEALDVYHLVLRLKCVLNHVFLKHVIAKKSLMEWDDHAGGIARQSSLTMNEARKGLVESKVMHWSLARCYQEALSNPVVLLRYPVQPNTLSGPPLKIQIQWQRPRKEGQPVLVDVSVTPNRCLSTSLWGVTVCLTGFGASLTGVEASACPEARWNPSECSFEWSIPIINPDDDVHHLKVKVTEKNLGPCPDYNLSACVKFVMPHATLSGTLLLGWLERKDASQSAPLFGADTTESAPDADLIFCEKMCLSGKYGADINY